MLRQLTLDLGAPPPATFENFFPGSHAANAELLARLRTLDAALADAASTANAPVADRTFYVWGEAGSGRSHLLRALVHQANRAHQGQTSQMGQSSSQTRPTPARARYLGPHSALAAFAFDARIAIHAIDDCDALCAAQQVALFNLFNEVRAHPACALVAAGNAAPRALAVREDLRTRLGWGLVFHLIALDDASKAAALKHAARERGLALADDVPAWLLTRYRRDMPSLMALLDALDRFALEHKRAVTLPLLRAMLAAEGETGAAGISGAAGASDAGCAPGTSGKPGVPDVPDASGISDASGAGSAPGTPDVTSTSGVPGESGTTNASRASRTSRIPDATSCIVGTFAPPGDASSLLDVGAPGTDNANAANSAGDTHETGAPAPMANAHRPATRTPRA